MYKSPPRCSINLYAVSFTKCPLGGGYRGEAAFFVMSGFVKIFRSLKEWEWYDDHNATRLLVHLLLSVNYEDKKWKGIDIPKGSMVLSWGTLSDETGLTVKQCRTAMSKLESSKEVARKVTNKYQLVSLVKWEKFQIIQECMADKRAVEGQAEGRQRATTKEYKEIKNKRSSTSEVPSYSEFESYALTKRPEVDTTHLKAKFESWVEAGWKDGYGNKILNWKSKLLNTLPHLKVAKQSFANEFFESIKNK